MADPMRKGPRGTGPDRYDNTFDIASRDYWFKIVEFLQQNWALIEGDQGATVVRFFGDDSGVFDSIAFASAAEAEQALRRNGFARFADDSGAGEFLAIPGPPFTLGRHPNGPIYSSGRFWK